MKKDDLAVNWENHLQAAAAKKREKQKQNQFEVVEDAVPEEEFDAEAIERAAQAEFRPLLDLSSETEKGPLNVQLDGEPRKVRSPSLPTGEAWFIDVKYMGFEYSMVLPRSLLFSLLALKKRQGWEKFAGQRIYVSAMKGTIKTPRFQGEAKTYKASPVIE